MPKKTEMGSPKRKKISDIFRSSKESNRLSRPNSSDSMEYSTEAIKLQEKNDLIISQECDRNNNKNNKNNVTDAKRRSGSFPVQPNPAEVADEMLLQMEDIMRRIVSVAMNDPGLLKTCWAVIETQSKRDEFIARLGTSNEFKPVIERPLRWDMKCVEVLNDFPATRIRPLGEFTEEKMALYLQEAIKTIRQDLGVIKDFVKVHQSNDDSLFRQLTLAYRNHLYKLMESLTATEWEDKPLNSILLFIGDFTRAFPRSEFAEFWQETDGHYDLGIISPEKYQDLTNGYLERQSAVIKMQMRKTIEIEYRHWLKGVEDVHRPKLATIQWPADVTDLCDQFLQVSLQIAPAVYHSMYTLLQMKLSDTIKLYAAGAKYYIHPCKLAHGSRCPELLQMKKKREETRPDSLSGSDRQTMHAILNSFALLYKYLATLSEKFPTTASDKQFLCLQSLVRAQSLECYNHYKKHVFRPTMKKYERMLLTEEWFQFSTTRDQLCDNAIYFTRALNLQYYDTWFDEVRQGVHHTYLKAFCKSAKHIKCENDEQRTQLATRLGLEEQEIQKTIRKNFPDYQDDYIKLLQQIADIIESTDQESCETSIAILKHTQRAIISKSHLKAILTVHGQFSSRHRRLIGTLYKSTS